MPEEIDPIIEVLADPRIIARLTLSRYRYHRPDVDVYRIPTDDENTDLIIRPYDIEDAACDTLMSRSLSPPHSLPLMKTVVEIALQELPNYESIRLRREQKAKRLQQQPVDQQG
ncbi:hypothetical protein KW794_00335 [Candidatus Saccharibacteria bacterium]|nr:hypothetical protein [Candidatus Saccharibacteria bacterium]